MNHQPSTISPTESRRIPELDGLRALAAAAVLLFHLKPPDFAWGWAGVDLFFVLSGYLITRILLSNAGSPGLFVSFYARRGLRIWPIYYLSLLVLVAVNPLLAHPQPMNGLPYYLTYTQNIQYYAFHEPPPSHVAFRHTWTLALEEQFYLIWPAVVLLCGRKRLIGACLAIAAGAYLARIGGYFAPRGFSLYILPARCDGFALGGLLAALRAGPMAASRRLRIGLILSATAGFAYLASGIASKGVIGVFGLPTPPEPGPVLLAINVMFLGVVGLALEFSGAIALIPLRIAPMAYLGRISYGIYMYHYMIYWALDGAGSRFDDKAPWPLDVLKIAATIALAALSWHLIERPILGWKDRFRYGPERPAKRLEKAVIEGD